MAVSAAPLAEYFGLVAQANAGEHHGLTSICSAHPLVIRAAFQEAQNRTGCVVIEATCNQVNQDGGYTGMTPKAFKAFVLDVAQECGFDAGRILFGGDHLGPNPWRSGSADAAMEKALVMVFDYAKAGFGKIHLDASMSCQDDPVPLADETIASRAALLARAAEAGAKAGGHPLPGYIIGTEVPVPGGATHALSTVALTRPKDAGQTIALHRAAFAKLGLADVLSRVVDIVVQPGVEFGHSDVIRFDSGAAQSLSQWRAGKGVVFEAHSTDYQTAEALRALVGGGFAILKVGPGLTFALREALYALDQIAAVLVPDYAPGTLAEAMEKLMLAEPGNWQSYYSGSDSKLQRHFSYSDRIRYYWGRPVAIAAVEQLMQALEGREIPETLISQYLPRCYDDIAQNGAVLSAEDIVIAHIITAIAPYSYACDRAATRA
ncbi:MAG: D-tagatose-bisphosphate aldolase, class II, non-catalytic subunit [Rhodobacteraceae bacterium]|nr:D-tagatose-bisphosphate aldolase, class II, non-catalytic subunit [Paracoccaceae bacterium]